jgi:YVTN family beta-propeller protein
MRMAYQQNVVVSAHPEHGVQQKSELKRPGGRGRWLVYLALVLGGTCFPLLVNAAPFAYVTNEGSNSVSVIDTATNTVVATVPAVGSRPRDIAITPDGSQAYVANLSNPGTVSIINTTTNSVVATISTGIGIEPTGVAIANPTGAFAYVTNFRSNTVSVIDTATRTVVASIGVGTEPTGIAVTPDGAFTYVTNISTSSSVGSVSVIDNVTRSVTTSVTVGMWPRDLAISPNGVFVYIANEKGNTVSVIATASNTVIATVPLSPEIQPISVAFTPDGAFAYVTNRTSGRISIIDTSTHSVVQTIPAGVTPIVLAFTPDGHYSYVTNNSTNTVSVIDTTTKLITATIGVGAAPSSVAITPPLSVAVDIQPGRCPNALNTKSGGGKLPVAILGTDTFDVNQVNTSSLRLNGVAPSKYSYADVAAPFQPFLGKKNCTGDCTVSGPDGYLDLMLQFERSEILQALGSVPDGSCVVLKLAGRLFNGTPIAGEDVVVILDKAPTP